MAKLKKQVTNKDLQYKGFPFECDNCGNKPTPQEVIAHNGECAICGDSIIAYTMDTAECIIKLIAETRCLDLSKKLIEARKFIVELGEMITDHKDKIMNR